MATIITRETGGTAVNRPLTNAELDNNFINLNTDIGTRIPSTEKGSANGVASLDSSGKVPSAQLPNTSATEEIVLNDISPQFDGLKGAFDLKLDQTAVSNITDSRNLEVVVSGKKLSPYVKSLTYPWITPYDGFRGYRVRDSKLIIYNPPDSGENALLVQKYPGTTTVQTKKYPYSATTVALGD
jgi:hypothetical protein